MPENNPNNIEGSKPLTPEEIEAFRQRLETQKKADEMLSAMERGEPADAGVRFTPSYPSEALAEKTAKVLKFPEKEESPVDEIGLDRVEGEKLRRDPIAWVNEALTRKDLDPNQAMLGLTESMEEEQKKKAA